MVPLKDSNLEQIVSLQDIDLKIKKGSFVVIVGETGSGKSSLLNAMIGEMIHLPDKTIQEIGDPKRAIKDGELRYLQHSLLTTDLTTNSPVKVDGTTSYCEQ